MTTKDNCKICGRDEQWHVDGNTHHGFADGSQPASAVMGVKRDKRSTEPANDGQGRVETVTWPHDPVLRQALIDKGVLTPNDLRDAEDKIRAVTSDFLDRWERSDGVEQGRQSGVRVQGPAERLPGVAGQRQDQDPGSGDRERGAHQPGTSCDGQESRTDAETQGEMT